MSFSNKMSSTGRIDIIMGCMFSGKSTELIRIANIYKVLEKKILIINHSFDQRYTEIQFTFGNLTIPCLARSDLNRVVLKNV